MVRIDARKCDIRLLSLVEEQSFLEENHFQKYAKSIIAYGLFYEDKLLQAMTFGRPRFNKNYQWEIIRDCTKKDYVVNGGASKLWNSFLKENKPYDCIVYSYPHKSNLYTNKYVEFCGFKNISKAKPTKKIYFEGIWNGKIKRIDKSILERHGVDRLLKTKQGHDRTNEQILLDLGFKKKYEDGFEPQVDSWFCGGCVYRMEIIGTDKFYIGQTIQDINTYWGSGIEWNKYIDDNNIPRDNEHIKKIILKDNFNNRKELYAYEYKEILKFVDIKNNKILEEYKDKCLNTLISEQWPGNFATCSECGGKNNHHKKGCSRARLCPECGGFITSHKKSCSKYNEKSACPECGSKTIHKPYCSRYKYVKCPECGVLGGNHKKECSRYKQPKNLCPFCNTPPGGRHKKECPNFKLLGVCEECGGSSYKHKKSCSKYKPLICSECGSVNSHKDYCSKSKSKPCEECGGKHGIHKKGCSKVLVCKECNAINGRHYKTCSKYKEKEANICSECGAKRGHFKTCSKYKKPNVCKECGTPYNRHKSTCSKAILCPECGGNENKHKIYCSKYKQ